MYTIRNVRRINGYERADGYVVEFSAEIHLLKNPADYFGSLANVGRSGTGLLAAVGLASAGLAKWGVVTAAAISAAQKGDAVPFSGSVTLIKSEQGWILRPDLVYIHGVGTN